MRSKFQNLDPQFHPVPNIFRLIHTPVPILNCCNKATKGLPFPSSADVLNYYLNCCDLTSYFLAPFQRAYQKAQRH